MKFHKSWIHFAGTGALLLAGQAAAQQAPEQSSQAMATSPTRSAPGTSHAAVYHTRQGELTVRSTMPDNTPMAPPSFDQLAHGSKSISEQQAASYPLLANDFGYADSNRNKRISRAEYKRWSSNK